MHSLPFWGDTCPSHQHRPRNIVEENASANEYFLGTRLRAFNRPSEEEVYVGLTNLGAQQNRTGGHVTWASGNNSFQFLFDKDADTMETVIINSNGRFTTTYTNVNQAIIDRNKKYSANEINTIALQVVERDNNATVDLLDVHLNHVSLGDFGVGESGWQTWILPNIDLRENVLLTGTLYLAGSLSTSAEKNKVEINLGAEKTTEACGVEAGETYTFYTPDPITITIPNDGLGDIDCLSVETIDETHPDADSEESATIDNGRYWEISGSNSDGSTASGFNISVTLPISSPASGADQACYWNDTSWTCANDAFGEASVSQFNVSEFGDWATSSNPFSCADIGATQPPTNGRVEIFGNSVKLFWTNQGAPNIDIWRFAAPYQAIPETATPERIATLDGTADSYIDSNALSVRDARFYAVQAYDECTSATTDQQYGKFSFELTPGN